MDATDLADEFAPLEGICHVPLLKSFERGKARDRIVCGLATVETEDVQGETVVVKGIDTSYLRADGKLRWEHTGKDPEDWLGKVLSHRIGRVREIVPREYWPLLKPGLLDRMGMWIESKLYRGTKKAEEVWNTLSNNPDSGWGFSLHGAKVRAKEALSGLLDRTVVHHIALTPQPVNTDTFATLAKSLATSYDRSNATDGQAMVPQSLGPQIADLTGAKTALKQFLAEVENGSLSVLDATESYFRAQGVDSETAQALVKFVRTNAGRVVTKSLRRGTMNKCDKCGAPLAEGLTRCPACAAAANVEELNKALGGDAPPAEDAETPPTSEHEAGETAEEETEEEKAKKKAEAEAAEKEKAEKEAAGEGAGASEQEPVAKSVDTAVETAATEPVDETVGDEPVLDVTQLVKSVEGGLIRGDQAHAVMAKALVASLRREDALQKSVESLNGKLDAMMDRFGVLMKTPKPRGGATVSVVHKSMEGTEQAGAADADTQARLKVRDALQKGLLTDQECFALDTGRATAAQVLKSLEARTPKP